jgi:hypothetical protein
VGVGGKGISIGIGGGGGARLLSGVTKSLAEGWVLSVNVEFVRSSGTNASVSADLKALEMRVVLDLVGWWSGVAS